MKPTIRNKTQKASWMEAAFGGLGLAMITTDKKGIVTLINERACLVLGLKTEEVVGKPLMELIGLWDTKENRPKAIPLNQVLENGIRITADEGVLMDMRSGRQIGVSVLVAPLRDEVGNVLGSLVTVEHFQEASKVPMKASEDHGINISQPEASGPRHSIYVRHGGRYIRVLIDELLWVEAMENYVQLQTTKDKFVVHVTMKNMAEALLTKGFRRIHRSFIVKVDAIESIEENHVIIDGMSLPIGKSFRSNLLDGLTLL